MKCLWLNNPLKPNLNILPNLRLCFYISNKQNNFLMCFFLFCCNFPPLNLVNIICDHFHTRIARSKNVLINNFVRRYVKKKILQTRIGNSYCLYLNYYYLLCSNCVMGWCHCVIAKEIQLLLNAACIYRVIIAVWSLGSLQRHLREMLKFRTLLATLSAGTSVCLESLERTTMVQWRVTWPDLHTVSLVLRHFESQCGLECCWPGEFEWNKHPKQNHITFLTSKVISRVFFGTWRTPVSANSPDTHTQGFAVNMEPPSFLLGMTTTWYGITAGRREKRGRVRRTSELGCMVFVPCCAATHWSWWKRWWSRSNRRH